MKTFQRAVALATSLLVAQIALAQQSLEDGLIARYTFNGNAEDVSGNGLHGTVHGAASTTDRFGNLNRAYAFNGSSSYITAPIGSPFFSQDFSASLWFKANNLTNSWPALLHERGQSFILQIPGSTCGCLGQGHLVSYSSFANASFGWFLERNQPISTNVYNHVVITKSGLNVSMYLNSQLVVTGSVTNSTIRAGAELMIGRAGNENKQGDSAFNGIIDDIRVYNRALQWDEIIQLYTQESAPSIGLLKAVKPSFTNLKVGTNYQLQISMDLNTWTNQGSTFTATNSTMVYPQYWDVENWNELFFRLQVAP